jgi:CRISPR/Cas system-associated endoribonuclease Cas2
MKFLQKSVYYGMLNPQERKDVLDYLYQKYMQENKDRFVIRGKMTAKLKAQMQYENLTDSQRKKIYKKIKN